MDKNAIALRDLIKEFKSNLAKSQELQILQYNKHVKKRIYQSEKSVWLRENYIKTKQNFKLEYKYLGRFKIVKTVENNTYRLKFSVQWRICLVFYVTLLKKNIIKKKVIDQKIVDQFQLKEKKLPKQEVDSIIDSIVFAKKPINTKSSEFYYFIYWKKKTYAKNTQKFVKKVVYLQLLLKNSHVKNANKPTVFSLPINKNVSLLLIAA